MMTPQIPQQELSELYSKGETVILAYRRAYEVKYSHGAQCYILQQFYQAYSGLPLTGRGRYMAFAPEYADKIIHTTN